MLLSSSSLSQKQEKKQGNHTSFPDNNRLQNSKIAMHHCRTTDPVPLQDSDIDKHNFMNFPELSKKKKAQQPRAHATEKKIFAAQEIEPHENDILLGRGGKNNMHVGNEKLRELARLVADKYHRSSKKEKSYLSRGLVQQVLEMDPPGRFLRRHTKDNHWEDKSEDEDKCREKCAQVLRDAVAYVGLKDPPASRASQQQSQFASSVSRDELSPLRSHQQQQLQYPAQMNPFAMSAATSNSIMNQHLMASGNVVSPTSGRQYSFPNFNPPLDRRNSLALSAGGYDPLSMPNASAAYARMSMSSAMPQSTQAQGVIEREAKRRRFSNFFDQHGSMPHTEPTIYGYDQRRPATMNSYPVGFDYQQHQMPISPRAAVAPRRDSLFGMGSDHSGPSLRDFELFPDMAVNVDAGTQRPPRPPPPPPPPPPKNDSDEFSSDFY